MTDGKRSCAACGTKLLPGRLVCPNTLLRKWLPRTSRSPRCSRLYHRQACLRTTRNTVEDHAVSFTVARTRAVICMWSAQPRARCSSSSRCMNRGRRNGPLRRNEALCHEMYDSRLSRNLRGPSDSAHRPPPREGRGHRPSSRGSLRRLRRRAFTARNRQPS